MTTEKFKQLWSTGKEVGVDFGIEVEANHASFPEAITAYHTSGVFYGVHFSFEELNTFSIEHEVCMFDLEIVDTETTIERRKASHGEHVYLIEMHGDTVFPVLEVEYGREYRALGTRCIIRKISL